MVNLRNVVRILKELRILNSVIGILLRFKISPKRNIQNFEHLQNRSIMFQLTAWKYTKLIWKAKLRHCEKRAITKSQVLS